MNRIKTCAAALLILFLAALLPLPAFASEPEQTGAVEKIEAGEESEESTEARIMRLEKTEGTVTVVNAKGKELDYREGARLYNGYQIITEEGYAWLSLDDTKVIKLDWYTKATVRKNGRKLEVLLQSGSLFFYISKELEEDESLDIRTSAMSTGIRGTLGRLTVHADESETGSVSCVEVYEGKVQFSFCEDNGDVITGDVGAGWRGDIRTRKSNEKDAASVPLSEGTLTDVSVKDALLECGFVAVEIRDNPEIQERLLREGDLSQDDLREIMEHAEEQLLLEQQQYRQKAEAVEKEILQVKQQMEIKQDLVFGSEPAEDSEELKEEEAEETEETEETEERDRENTQTDFKEPETGKDNGSQGSQSSSSGGGGIQNEQAQENEQTQEPRQFLVTFCLEDGTLYASQQVKEGEKAKKPILRPGISGEWTLNGEVYDFSLAVKGDLTLRWKE